MTLHRATVALLILVILLTMYGVGRIALRLPFQPAVTPVSTLAAFAFALVHAGQRLGWRRAVLLLALIFGVSLLFESVGVATGVVYGPYHYTDRLGIKFLGLVPYLIPLAWFMMMYPALLIAQWLLPDGLRGRLIPLAATAGLVMTSWDLALDPLMVQAGHWVWDVRGAYFGVPLHNYAGWWLTTFVTFILFLWAKRMPFAGSTKGEGLENRRESSSLDRLAILAYATTGLGSALAAWGSGLGGPALVGFIAMAPWIVLAWRRSAHKPEPARLKTSWF